MNYTPKQLQILKLIQRFQDEHGYSPTYAELAKQLGVSTITVFEHLEALERKNAIRRRRHEARSVEIIEPNFLRENAARKTLAVKGLIAAGFPIEAVEDAAAEEMPRRPQQPRLESLRQSAPSPPAFFERHSLGGN